MITGFNTDIERDGVIYHVQTEDKGLDSPLILSLVYSGGEILAAKRTPYEDLITSGFDDQVLAERLSRQHRLICAAINAGRIDDLKRMSASDRGTKPPGDTDSSAVVTPEDEFEIEIDLADEIEVVPVELVPVYEELEINTAASKTLEDEFILETAAERPTVQDEVTAPEISDEFILDTAAEIVPVNQWQPPINEWKPPVKPPVDEETEEVESSIPDILAQGPVDQSDLPPKPLGSTADESAYTVYDSRRAARAAKKKKPKDGLELTLLDDEEFRAGETVTVRVLVQHTSASNQKPLGGVTVSVKVLGTTFRPQIQSVKTERDGVAIVTFDIPRFTSGRAAVLVRAEANDESTEMRRVILPAF